MQEYIDEHLREKISLKQIGGVSGYSPWHAARIFKEVTGKTPFEYIRVLRLSKAALTLRDGEHKIIDVALDFVFDSHEGFTRAFTKKFGLSPSKYSKNTPPIQLFLPERAFDTYRALLRGASGMSAQKETKTVFVQVIERPARKVLLKRGKSATEYFEYCNEVGCDVWALLSSIKEALYEPIGMWLPEHLIPDGTSKYVQGVELPLDYSNEVPSGYDLIELPPCKMMVFQGEPFDDEDFMEAIEQIYNTIEKYNPEIYGYRWATGRAPRFQLAPMGYRGYIEAMPVVEIK
ncbi:MAG: AraC family transcriptional regulator [Bacillota bacterium]